MNLAHRYEKINLNKKISLKGRDEQELQYLFPTLYSNKSVTNNTKGVFKQFDKQISKRVYIPYL